MDKPIPQKGPNPWLSIPPADYESHMAHRDVAQLQALSGLIRERIERYRPGRVAVFGACTGNGFEHIPPACAAVYAVDINSAFLAICRERHGVRLPALQTITMDLSTEDVPFGGVDLIIADLFLEYVDVDWALGKMAGALSGRGILSVTIQENNNRRFVSETGIASLEILSSIAHDVGAGAVKAAAIRHKLALVRTVTLPLPNGKSFASFDFAIST